MVFNNTFLNHFLIQKLLVSNFYRWGYSGFGWGMICPCISTVKNKLDIINIDFS
jgi:hypothetical protein